MIPVISVSKELWKSAARFFCLGRIYIISKGCFRCRGRDLCRTRRALLPARREPIHSRPPDSATDNPINSGIFLLRFTIPPTLCCAFNASTNIYRAIQRFFTSSSSSSFAPPLLSSSFFLFFSFFSPLPYSRMCKSSTSRRRVRFGFDRRRVETHGLIFAFIFFFQQISISLRSFLEVASPSDRVAFLFFRSNSKGKKSLIIYNFSTGIRLVRISERVSTLEKKRDARLG